MNQLFNLFIIRHIIDNIRINRHISRILILNQKLIVNCAVPLFLFGEPPCFLFPSDPEDRFLDGPEKLLPDHRL